MVGTHAKLAALAAACVVCISASSDSTSSSSCVHGLKLQLSRKAAASTEFPAPALSVEDDNFWLMMVNFLSFLNLQDNDGVTAWERFRFEFVSTTDPSNLSSTPHDEWRIHVPHYERPLRVFLKSGPNKWISYNNAVARACRGITAYADAVAKFPDMYDKAFAAGSAAIGRERDAQEQGNVLADGTMSAQAAFEMHMSEMDREREVLGKIVNFNADNGNEDALDELLKGYPSWVNDWDYLAESPEKPVTAFYAREKTSGRPFWVIRFSQNADDFKVEIPLTERASESEELSYKFVDPSIAISLFNKAAEAWEQTSNDRFAIKQLHAQYVIDEEVRKRTAKRAEEALRKEREALERIGVRFEADDRTGAALRRLLHGYSGAGFTARYVRGETTDNEVGRPVWVLKFADNYEAQIPLIQVTLDTDNDLIEELVEPDEVQRIAREAGNAWIQTKSTHNNIKLSSAQNVIDKEIGKRTRKIDVAAVMQALEEHEQLATGMSVASATTKTSATPAESARPLRRRLSWKRAPTGGSSGHPVVVKREHSAPRRAASFGLGPRSRARA